MTLRWLTDAPEATARRLAAQLGLRHDTGHGGFSVHLGTANIEVAALPPHGRRDDRLELNPPDVDPANPPDPRHLDAPEAPDTGPATGSATPEPPFTLAAVGLGTVDAERFALERGWDRAASTRDAILGGSTFGIFGAPRLVLLEPDTEGRLVASLARFGEGPVALFLVATAGVDPVRQAMVGRGVRVSAVAGGPFGREFALAGDRFWGPHIVIVEQASIRLGAGTIGA